MEVDDDEVVVVVDVAEEEEVVVDVALLLLLVDSPDELEFESDLLSFVPPSPPPDSLPLDVSTCE